MEKTPPPPIVRSAPPPENAVVATHNDILGSMARLSLQEHRLLAFCLAHYDSRAAPENGFEATVKDLVGLFPGMNIRHAYNVVQASMRSLGGKPLEFMEETPKGKLVKRLRHWFGGMDYIPDEGRFTFYINPQIAPYLTALEGCFTSYRLQNVRHFGSAMTWKFFHLCKKWQGAGAWTVGLDELRGLLGVAGKYPRWGNFKAEIDKAITEIHEQADITITYSGKRYGRRMDGLVISIEGRRPEHREDDIVVEQLDDQLRAELLKASVHEKTTNSLVLRAVQNGKAEALLRRLPGILERAAAKGKNRQKYLVGAINQEIDQGDLDFSAQDGQQNKDPNQLYRQAVQCRQRWLAQGGSCAAAQGALCDVCSKIYR